MKSFLLPESTSKIFINVCHSDTIGPAISTPAKNKNKKKRGERWSIPYSLTPPRNDVDKCESRERWRPNAAYITNLFNVIIFFFHRNAMQLTTSVQWWTQSSIQRHSRKEKMYDFVICGAILSASAILCGSIYICGTSGHQRHYPPHQIWIMKS